MNLNSIIYSLIFFISLIQEGLLNFVSLDDIFSIIKFSKIDSKNIYFFLFLNIRGKGGQENGPHIYYLLYSNSFVFVPDTLVCVSVSVR